MDDAAMWMKGVVACNPLSYGVAAVRGLLSANGTASLTELGVTAGFSVVMFILACISARERQNVPRKPEAGK